MKTQWAKSLNPEKINYDTLHDAIFFESGELWEEMWLDKTPPIPTSLQAVLVKQEMEAGFHTYLERLTFGWKLHDSFDKKAFDKKTRQRKKEITENLESIHFPKESIKELFEGIDKIIAKHISAYAGKDLDV